MNAITRNIQIRYLDIDSALSRMDPLSKFLLVVCMSLIVYWFSNPIQIVPFFVFVVFIVLVLGRVPVKVMMATFSIFIAFGAVVFFFQLLANHGVGRTLFNVGFLEITEVGVNQGLTFFLRLATLGCSALIFIWSTKPKEFVVGLARYRLPYRLGFSVLVALRFMPLIQEEVKKVKDAQTIRGISHQRGLRGRVDRWRRYMFPVLANGLRKAEATSIAMDSRAFGRFKTRTYLQDFRWTWQGLALLLALFALALGLAAVYGIGFVQPRYR